MGGLVHWFATSLSGPNGIPTRVLEHVWYSLVATGAAAVVALPIGIGIGHAGRGGTVAINLANAGRALPTFGLIILAFLVLGFGFSPVLVALVVLAAPPIVTNSYAGMRAVDPDVADSARGMGMTGWQVLAKVELPIALPLVLAGLRTAAVQVVATATLAAYVGLGGLGRYLIDGLSQQRMPEVLGGAILVALLAILTEAAFAGLQRLVVVDGTRARPPAGAPAGAKA